MKSKSNSKSTRSHNHTVQVLDCENTTLRTHTSHANLKIYMKSDKVDHWIFEKDVCKKTYKE